MKLFFTGLWTVWALGLWAQHNPSSYYATNPSGQLGTTGTITIDGNIADWSSAKLIAQGVANDDPRIFRGSHEGPVYDMYALYASWDANNLYLMWQYCNVTDVSDPAQGYPISNNGKPYNINIPICIALDIDPNAQTDGLIDGTTNSVWANGRFNTFANGTDHLLMFSTKPGVGQPALFKMNANGKFDYTSTYAIPFGTAGITYQYGDAFLSSTLFGINSNGGAGFVPSQLSNAANYVNFKASGLGHSAAQETFYEIKIPLTALGITQSYLENYGIGAQVISTFGNSAIGSLPHDNTILDNATLAYTLDTSTSREKEDQDNFTAPMARIGHALVPCGVTEVPTVIATPTSILVGNSSTLTASGCGSGQTYRWESGQTTAVITVSPNTTTSYRVKCVGTCEGTYSASTLLSVTCAAPSQVPSLSPTAVSINYGASTALTASGCGAGQTYLWSSGQSTASITVSPSSTSTYTARCVSSTGCPGNVSTASTVTLTGGASCQQFSWDNATVYFLLIDRFNNGLSTNDASYGRQPDPAGGFMGGDFKGITQKIQEKYFDNLGVNALWITAPYEQMHGFVSGYGSDPAFAKHYAYHGYYPLDFTQPDSAYGTRLEFKALVDSAHAHGIRVVVDIVMNHLAYDNQGDVNKYLGGFPVTDQTNTGWCNWWGSNWIRKANGYCATAPGSDDLTMSLAGLPDIKTEVTTSAANTTAGLPPMLQTKWGSSHENKLATEISSLDSYFTRTGKPKTPRHYLIKWLTDWVREYGIDGFRIDTYKHVGRDVWGELNDEADLALAEWKAANPTKKLDDKPFWSVGEWWGHGVGKNVEAVSTGKTDALINFTFKGAAASPTTIDATYANYANTLNTDPTWNALSYISSHDDGMFDRNNLFNAGTSLLLAPGAVQIYYGDESGRPLGTVAAGTDQPTRSFMNWASTNTTLLSHWQKLGVFRRNHPAIGAGSHAKIADSPYTFSRNLTSTDACGGCDKVIVVVGASGNTTVNVSSVFTNGTLLRDAYTGNTATVASGNVAFVAGSQGVILIENPAGCVVCTPPTEVPTVAASPTSINLGASSTITASGCGAGQTYEWETGQTTSAILVSPTTATAQFKARCVAADGCKGPWSALATLTVVGGTVGITVYFKRPSTWTTTPQIYSWTGTNTAQSGAWPGSAMTLHCGDWYKYNFPQSITSINVIFNNGVGGGTNQTPDLLNISTDSRYNGASSMTATTLTAGAPTDCPCLPPTQIPNVTANPSTIATGQSSTLTASGCASGQSYRWETGETTTSIVVSPTANTLYKASCVAADGCQGALSAGTQVTVTGGSTITVFFKRPSTWSAVPRAYVWTGTSTAQNGAWPGGLMTLHCGNWYKYTFPSGVTSANIIFNNGSGGGTNQTPDLLNVSATSWYDGAASMTATTMTAGEPTDCPDPNAIITVYFKRPTSWTAVPKAYAWTGSSTAQNGAWPGSDMTLHCGSWYKYSFPAGVSGGNVIFNNGNGGIGTNQTPDLTNITVNSRYDGTASMSATTMTAGEPTDCPCTVPAAPTSATASPSYLLSGNTTSLTAAGCAGGTIHWFAAATGGTSLGSGSPWTTAALNTSTTFYAECQLAANCVSATRTAVLVTVCGTTDLNVPGSGGDISSGTVHFETNGAITALNKIIGTLWNVRYDARKFVQLSPGFEVRPTANTAVFEAYIEGCGNN
jgi:alpha-amylase